MNVKWYVGSDIGSVFPESIYTTNLILVFYMVNKGSHCFIDFIEIDETLKGHITKIPLHQSQNY